MTQSFKKMLIFQKNFDFWKLLNFIKSDGMFLAYRKQLQKMYSTFILTIQILKIMVTQNLKKIVIFKNVEFYKIWL